MYLGLTASEVQSKAYSLFWAPGSGEQHGGGHKFSSYSSSYQTLNVLKNKISFIEESF